MDNYNFNFTSNKNSQISATENFNFLNMSDNKSTAGENAVLTNNLNQGQYQNFLDNDFYNNTEPALLLTNSQLGNQNFGKFPNQFHFPNEYNNQNQFFLKQNFNFSNNISPKGSQNYYLHDNNVYFSSNQTSQNNPNFTNNSNEFTRNNFLNNSLNFVFNNEFENYSKNSKSIVNDDSKCCFQEDISKFYQMKRSPQKSGCYAKNKLNIIHEQAENEVNENFQLNKSHKSLDANNSDSFKFDFNKTDQENENTSKLNFMHLKQINKNHSLNLFQEETQKNLINSEIDSSLILRNDTQNKTSNAFKKLNKNLNTNLTLNNSDDKYVANLKENLFKPEDLEIFENDLLSSFSFKNRNLFDNGIPDEELYEILRSNEAEEIYKMLNLKSKEPKMEESSYQRLDRNIFTENILDNSCSPSENPNQKSYGVYPLAEKKENQEKKILEAQSGKALKSKNAALNNLSNLKKDYKNSEQNVSNNNIQKENNSNINEKTYFQKLEYFKSPVTQNKSMIDEKIKLRNSEFQERLLPTNNISSLENKNNHFESELVNKSKKFNALTSVNKNQNCGDEKTIVKLKKENSLVNKDHDESKLLQELFNKVKEIKNSQSQIAYFDKNIIEKELKNNANNDMNVNFNNKELENSNIKIEKINIEEDIKNFDKKVLHYKKNFSLENIVIPDKDTIKSTYLPKRIVEFSEWFSLSSFDAYEYDSDTVTLPYLNKLFEEKKLLIKYANQLSDNFTKLFSTYEHLRIKFQKYWSSYLLNHFAEVEFFNNICSNINENYKMDLQLLEERINNLQRKYYVE